MVEKEIGKTNVSFFSANAVWHDIFTNVCVDWHLMENVVWNAVDCETFNIFVWVITMSLPFPVSLPTNGDDCICITWCEVYTSVNMWEHFGETKKQPKNNICDFSPRAFEITDQCSCVQLSNEEGKWTVNPPLSGICLPNDFLNGSFDCSAGDIQ